MRKKGRRKRTWEKRREGRENNKKIKERELPQQMHTKTITNCLDLPAFT